MSKKHSHKQSKKQNRLSAKDLFKTPKESKNNSKKTEIKKMSWIKRLMSMSRLGKFLSLLAMLVSSGTLFFTVLKYCNDRPAHVTRELCCLDNTMNIDDYIMFISLLHSSNRKIVICSDNESMNRLFGCPFPTIKNNSNKTINNFKLDVEVYVNGSSYFNEKDINKDFEITKIDSINRSEPGKLTLISFKYKYDVLHAKSSVTSPLNVLYIPDSVAFSDDYHVMMFNFQITYEGIEMPIKYTEFLYVNFNETSTLTNNTIEHYLNELHEKTAFTLNYNQTLISIRERANFIFLNPRDISVNESDFEYYKSTIIKKYNMETKTEQFLNWD